MSSFDLYAMIFYSYLSQNSEPKKSEGKGEPFASVTVGHLSLVSRLFYKVGVWFLFPSHILDLSFILMNNCVLSI